MVLGVVVVGGRDGEGDWGVGVVGWGAGIQKLRSPLLVDP